MITIIGYASPHGRVQLEVSNRTVTKLTTAYGELLFDLRPSGEMLVSGSTMGDLRLPLEGVDRKLHLQSIMRILWTQCLLSGIGGTLYATLVRQVAKLTDYLDLEEDLRKCAL